MMFLASRLIKLFGCCALIGSAAGCSWTDKNVTHRYIVGIGFGIITTTNYPGVSVMNSSIAGGEIGPYGFGVGLMNRHEVQIDPEIATNLVISIQSTPNRIVITNYPVTPKPQPK